MCGESSRRLGDRKLGILPASRFRSYFGQLGKLLILISNPKHPLLGFRVCELLCNCACGCCAVAPVLRVAQKRFHVPLGRYAGLLPILQHLRYITNFPKPISYSRHPRNQSPSGAQQTPAATSSLPESVTQNSASPTRRPSPSTATIPRSSPSATAMLILVRP
jgi:hypothetical protein